MRSLPVSWRLSKITVFSLLLGSAILAGCETSNNSTAARTTSATGQDTVPNITPAAAGGGNLASTPHYSSATRR